MLDSIFILYILEMDDIVSCSPKLSESNYRLSIRQADNVQITDIFFICKYQVIIYTEIPKTKNTYLYIISHPSLQARVRPLRQKYRKCAHTSFHCQNIFFFCLPIIKYSSSSNSNFTFSYTTKSLTSYKNYTEPLALFLIRLTAYRFLSL